MFNEAGKEGMLRRYSVVLNFINVGLVAIVLLGISLFLFHDYFPETVPFSLRIFFALTLLGILISMVLETWALRQKEKIERNRVIIHHAPAIVEVANRFHDKYEYLAPNYHYKTRRDTRMFSPYSPNGQLMLAVVKQLADDGVIIVPGYGPPGPE